MQWLWGGNVCGLAVPAGCGRSSERRMVVFRQQPPVNARLPSGLWFVRTAGWSRAHGVGAEALNKA